MPGAGSNNAWRGHVDPSRSKALRELDHPVLAEKGIDDRELRDRAESGRLEGQTSVFDSIDARLAGVLGIADPHKDSASEAVKALHNEGLRVIMLTGDSRTTAAVVARKLGFDDVHAEVIPEEKGEVIKKLRAEGRVVAMAGDGINDASALALADVGIAMATDTDSRWKAPA